MRIAAADYAPLKGFLAWLPEVRQGEAWRLLAAYEDRVAPAKDSPHGA